MGGGKLERDIIKNSFFMNKCFVGVVELFWILSLVSPLLRYWFLFPLSSFSLLSFSLSSHTFFPLPDRFPIDIDERFLSINSPSTFSCSLPLPPHPPLPLPFLFDHHLELPRSKISPPPPLPTSPSTFSWSLPLPPPPPTSPSCLAII